MNTMIDFLAGALTLGFVITGAGFLRFWKRTGDRLFLSFAVAFWLFAANQVLTSFLAPDREVRYEYILRVLGFVVILVGIARKNAEREPGGSK
jgi:uncharacterized protein DUF5985